MAMPVNTVAAGGIPVVECLVGTPVEEAANGYGIPVTKVVHSLGGLPVTYSVFTPASLGSQLRAWYAFDTLTGANGDPQGAVLDASGNAFNLSQTGTARPTLAAAEQNGLNTLRFTAASSQRYPLDRLIMAGSAAGSYYAVLKVVSGTAANGGPRWGMGSTNYVTFTDGKIYEEFGTTIRKTITPPVAMTSYRIISVLSAPSDYSYFLDGGAGGPTGGTAPLLTDSNNPISWQTNGSILFLGSNDVSAFFNGWYAELIYTNAKQTTGVRQRMEGYLAHKWGLTGNLDPTHPYKTVKP